MTLFAIILCHQFHSCHSSFFEPRNFLLLRVWYLVPYHMHESPTLQTCVVLSLAKYKEVPNACLGCTSQLQTFLWACLCNLGLELSIDFCSRWLAPPSTVWCLSTPSCWRYVGCCRSDLESFPQAASNCQWIHVLGRCTSWRHFLLEFERTVLPINLLSC